MDKRLLRSELLATLQRDLSTLTAAALSARDEATHEESRPENKYDMHSQEAAYLAEGQARMAAELRQNIELFLALDWRDWTPNEPITIGAVVTLEGASGDSFHYFMGPAAGGAEVTIHEATVLVITPASPVGRLLLGRRRGDLIPLPTRTGKVMHTITAVA